MPDNFYEIRKILADIGVQLDRVSGQLTGLRQDLAKVEQALPPLTAATAPAVAGGDAQAAGKPLQVAVIGGGLHGTKTVKALLGLKECRIRYICDVDHKKGAARVAEIKQASGQSPKVVSDFREALADPLVDAVVICTPHHWHALAAVWAVQAGKHVYVEKPVTHSVAEGPILRAAAHRHDLVVMPGTQLRSNRSLIAAGEYMRAGKLGQISLVHCIIHKNRPPLAPTNDPQIPASVNYDMWLGPRPDQPMTRSKFHYHWHWFWEFGNGALGNNGIHRIDAARLALDLQGRGDLVLSIGGIFGPSDMIETPNTQLCLHRFGDIWVLQDVLGVQPKPYRGMENAVVFHGSEGVIVYKSGYATLCDHEFKPISVFEGKQASHYRGFFQAIRNKSYDESRALLDEAILSGDLCHFGNISHRSGAPADDATILARLDQLKVPPFVIERFHAMRANIAAASPDDLAEPQLTLGQLLTLQEGPQPFRNASAATDALLRCEERPPFNLMAL